MHTNPSAAVNTSVSTAMPAGRSFQDLIAGRHPECLDAALRTLSGNEDVPESARLIRLALADPESLKRIADPGFLPTRDAIRVARRLHAINESMDVRLLQLLETAESAGAGSWQDTRILEIVAAISDGNRIRTLLPKFLRHPDPRVRSKVALLIGRFSPNPGWLGRYLKDPDPRVRANAVESMWGARHAGDLFLVAIADENERVAANAIVGLHRAGDAAAVRVAAAMSSHADPRFRAAAAWAMGECQDPCFLEPLARMLKEPEGLVRRNALRATVRLRKQAAQQP